MLLAPGIDREAVMGGKLRLRFVGGQDGVTGANQFEAWGASGGQDALLMPGTATLAWVAGDSRVRFDAARLIPLFASVSVGLLMIRPSIVARHAALRIACTGAVEPGVAGLLALDLLGIGALPTHLSLDCVEAVRAGLVDAVFLHGPDVPRQRREIEALGLRPCFAIGGGAAGTPRETWLADVPTLTEELAVRPEANLSLLQAYHAVAAASVLDVALALPALSGPAAVARWRMACGLLCNSPDIEDVAAARSLRLVYGEASADAMHPLLVDGLSQSVLRRWLSTRLDWRPT
jgi:hypothetical protein